MAAAGAGLGRAIRAVQTDGGKRFMAGLFAGGSSFLSHLGRVAHALFLEVTGFLFLVIAVGLGSKTFHEYRAYAATHASPMRLYVASFFFILFTYFGLSSFWRARK